MSSTELPPIEDPAELPGIAAPEPTLAVTLPAGASAQDAGEQLTGDVDDQGFGELDIPEQPAAADMREVPEPETARLAVRERTPPPDAADTAGIVDRIASRTSPDEVRQSIAAVAARHSRDWNDFPQQLETNGNEAYEAVAPVQIVHVPVAAEREEQLDVTLEQVKRQHDEAPGPVSVVVSANYPADRAEDKAAAIRANLDIIQDAQRTFDDIPMSHYVTAYPPETTIGQVRDHLLTAGVLSYGRQMEAAQAPPRDILLSGWDADTLQADSGYFAEMQERYAQSQAKAWGAYPEHVLHGELDPDRFPNVNSLIGWLNVGTQHGVVEVAQQQFTLNLGAFGASDGYHTFASGEQTYLWTGAEQNAGYDQSTLVALRGVKAVVSPRRLVSHMYEGRSVGYGRLTSSTEAPVVPQADLTGSLYTDSLYKVLDYSAWQVVEGKREELLLRDGLEYDKARQRAAAYAKGVFHQHAEATGATSEVHRAIDEVLENIYDPFAHRAYLQAH